MANKRSRDTQSSESHEPPPQKKQKLSDDPLDIKNDDQKLLVTTNTELGESQKAFNLHDLVTISYFSNRFSGRWGDSNQCTIASKDLCFSVHELSMLIFYKKHQTIDPTYSSDRLIYFCNAVDYFAETVDIKAFTLYLSQHIPALQYHDLNALSSLCDGKKECNHLFEAIVAAKKQIKIDNKKLDNKVIKNWKKVHISLLTSNTNVATAVFIETMKFRSSYPRDPLIFNRSGKDLSAIWKCILNNKAYVSHPEVIDCIYRFKCQRPKPLSNDIAPIITNITIDILGFCLNELKRKHDETYSMIVNIFNLMNSTTSDSVETYCHYDYLFAVLKKLLMLRTVDCDKFSESFGNDIISKLLGARLSCFGRILKVGMHRNVLNDIAELKINEKLSEHERHQLLKSILDNYKSIQKSEDLQHLVKGLIDLNLEKSFKLAHLWFPLLMKDHKNWIINEIPKKTSFKSLRILFDGIYKYASTQETEVDNAYFEFINNYTNIQQNITHII